MSVAGVNALSRELVARFVEDLDSPQDAVIVLESVMVGVLMRTATTDPAGVLGAFGERVLDRLMLGAADLVTERDA